MQFEPPQLPNFAYYGAFRATTMLAAAPGNRSVATAAIEHLYEQLGRFKPSVFWCQGPFQMCAMQRILPEILASQQWSTISKDFKLHVFPERDWSAQYSRLFEDQIKPAVEQIEQILPISTPVNRS